MCERLSGVNNNAEYVTLLGTHSTLSRPMKGSARVVCGPIRLANFEFLFKLTNIALFDQVGCPPWNIMQDLRSFFRVKAQFNIIRSIAMRM